MEREDASLVVNPPADRSVAVEAALSELARGRAVTVHEDGPAGSVLVAAAESITPDRLAGLNRRAGGRVCLALTAERCAALGLEPLADGESAGRADFTAAIGVRYGAEEGAGAAAQARTMRVAIDPSSDRDAIVLGGHVQPLLARAGGVLARRGAAEAAVDLARLAGFLPAAVLCPIDPEHRLGEGPGGGHAEISISELVAYRRRYETTVERVVETFLPTEFGEFRAVGYRSPLDGGEFLVLVRGDVEGKENVPVRIHARCLAGDVFHACDCTCGSELRTALKIIEAEGRGVVIYVDRNSSPAAADPALGAEILSELGVASVCLLANGNDEAVDLAAGGVVVRTRIGVLA